MTIGINRLHSEIDHLVVTAPSLEAGAEYLHRVLGVIHQAGGKHPRMGTHNRLIKLGSTSYLEVIAVDPEALKPDRPRWFDLDELGLNATPRLAAWVVRVNDIEAGLAAASIPLGKIETMSRGKYHWRITVPEDGSPVMQGVAPSLIQWAQGEHPASQLNDQGCSIARLEGFHPEAERITDLLKAIGFAGEFAIRPVAAGGKPQLSARIQTPGGIIHLGGG